MGGGAEASPVSRSLNSTASSQNPCSIKRRCNRVPGNIVALIRDFLSNRKQRVVPNGKTSKWKDVLGGVPQGSVPDLLLFLVYINDLCDNLNFEVKLFANDTSLFSVIENELVGADELNRDLEKKTALGLAVENTM